MTHFSQTATTLTAEVENSASVRASLDKVDAKNRRYKDLCNQQGVDFLAMPVCSYGGWLASGTEVVRRLVACMTKILLLPVDLYR